MMDRVRFAVFAAQRAWPAFAAQRARLTTGARIRPLLLAALLLLPAPALAESVVPPANAAPVLPRPAPKPAEPAKSAPGSTAPAQPVPAKATPATVLPDKVAPVRTAREQILPAHVSAVYRISFGLLGEIGNFKFQSHIDGESYALTADAKIDTSIFDYVGAMKSKGAVGRAALARPADYMFRYWQKALFGKKKVRSLTMAFNSDGVKGVTFVPPDPPSRKAIPVTEAQLKSALDPLTGVMALSLGDIKRPCDQRLPIFDGKQRFDLVFTPTGRTEGPDHGHVCNVRFVSISGHKPGEGAGSVLSGKIEVVLRPVPKANILIPYRVTVPTIIGAAVLMSERVDITMPDRQKIALRR